MEDLREMGVTDVSDVQELCKEMVGAAYPKTKIQQCIIRQIRNSTRLVSYKDIKVLICTANSIGNFNRQLRKIAKPRSVFPTDDSLLKMLCLAMVGITKKWTGRCRDWGEIHFQLELFFWIASRNRHE